MKITKQHRKCFKEALEYLGKNTNWICPAIEDTTASEQLQKECKEILFHYFQTEPGCALLYFRRRDDLAHDELLNCRLIALYTLIYAPL